MKLTWELCDRKQKVLTRLDNRRGGGRIEIGANKARQAFVPLSLEDPAFALAQAIKTILRVTLESPFLAQPLPVFIGRVTVPNQTSQPGGEELGLNAVDPLFQLMKMLIRKENGSIWEPVSFKGTDQSLIMWELIAAIAGHGVIKGELPASKARDRTYPPGKEIGLALQQMSEVIEGPDFMLTPVVASDGTLCKFDTFSPKLGSDKSSTVKFVHGAAPYTASDYSLSPGGDSLINRVLALGVPREGSESQEFPAYLAEVAASVAEYDPFEKRIQFEDVVETATLEAHAKGEVEKTGLVIPFFDFTTALEQADTEVGEGIPPRFGLDYWVGDTVGVEAHLPDPGATPLNLTGRITDSVITEADTRQLSVKHSCTTTAAAGAVTGKALTLKIPEGVE